MILVSWMNTLKVHLFYCFGGCRLSGAIREPKTTAPAVQNHLMYRIIGKHDPRCKKKGRALCSIREENDIFNGLDTVPLVKRWHRFLSQIRSKLQIT